MANFRIFSTEQFKLAFPRARQHDTADAYVVWEGKSRSYYPDVPASIVGDHEVVKLSSTRNGSGITTCARYALVARP